jgi:hypothetical protein
MLLGREHPDTLMSMNNRVNVLTNQGKYEQVEKMHRQSLGPRETALGKEYHDTLISMNNSAAARSSRQKRCINGHWD